MGDKSRQSRQIYEFGGYRLDPLRRLLLGRDGAPIRLKPKVFDTLLYLVEHAGEALDKSTLVEAIWPNLVVEENNLNKNVSMLRRALGERPGDHRFIVTEPGRGYRFVANVRAAPVGTETVAPHEPSRSRSRARWSTVDYVVTGLLAAAIVVAIARSAARGTSTRSRCVVCSRRMAEWSRERSGSFDEASCDECES
jgi:DNA-binding winged helix-turn-helix (wHTH) protein